MSRIFADTPRLRATGEEFKRAGGDYGWISRELRGRPLPMMPGHVVGHVRSQMHTAAGRVQSLSHQAWADGGMMVTTAGEFERASQDDGYAGVIAGLERDGKLANAMFELLTAGLATPDRLRMKQWVSSSKVQDGGYWRSISSGQRERINWTKAWHPAGWQHVKESSRVASGLKWAKRVGKVGIGLNFVIPAAEQAFDDWDDPTLSNRDVAARVAMAAGMRGAAATGGALLGGWAGATAGGAAGASIGAIIGAPFGGIGAVPGAAIGGAIGAAVGGFGGAFGGAQVGDKIGKAIKNTVFKKLWGR